MGEKEFKEELDKRFGDGFSDSLKCQKCRSDLIHCPHCQEVLCPNGCDEK